MSLYLKYRPKDFSSLVGQEFVKKALKAAVSQDKTVGAYIFTGPRGTGKTSSARILAKAVNCLTPNDGDPCHNCEMCKQFDSGSLVDVVEIDAASHTGVDNIREIIERAQFSPTIAKYKVYIIDEVHMLSKGAFNALLKILEEPPKHIKFILATTEIHKVLDTVLSRCQRYDFTNFSDEEIRQRLTFIAKNENFSYDDESIDYIVKQSEGGMRNAINLFEQLISDNTLDFKKVQQTIGLVSMSEKDQFIEKLFKRDTELLTSLDMFISSGKNMYVFFKDLIGTIQKDAGKKLVEGEDIRGYIEILENLTDMLAKAKRSFDPNIVYKISFLKILSNYSEQSITSNTQNALAIEKPSVIVKKQELINVEIPENSSKEDFVETVADLFAGDRSIGEGESTGRFDSSAFIAHTKLIGGKAALIMSLKGSEFTLDDSKLFIKTKTKIAFNTISKPENKEILFTARDDLQLGFNEIVVK